MLKNLDPDQARCFIGPDLGSNCLQRLSADNTSRQIDFCFYPTFPFRTLKTNEVWEMANSVNPDQTVPSGLMPLNRSSCLNNRETFIIQCTCCLILSLLTERNCQNSS